MPNINQMMVMPQGIGPNGHETCGYHTLKNTLLGLMWAQGIITEKKFTSLRNDVNFFQAIFDKTKASANTDGDVDLSLPRFNELLIKIKNGEFDFSAHGISNASLQALKLDTDLIALQILTPPGMPPIGHQGELTDLKIASSLVRLARTDGSVNRAFAMGLDNRHWVAALLKQDKQGVKKWFFMDSFNNNEQYKDSAINKIESILQKNEQELQAYLLTAYDNVNDLELHNRYSCFFDPETGLPWPEKQDGYGPTGQESWDATDFFIKKEANLREYLSFINNNVQFMNEAGWFTSPGEEEKARMSILYHVASFISNNAEATSLNKETKEQLSTVCKQLETALSAETITEKTLTTPLPSEQHDEDFTTQLIALIALLGDLYDIKMDLGQKALNDDQYKQILDNTGELYNFLDVEINKILDNPTKEQYQQCYADCVAKIERIEKESKQHRGWHLVNPIIRGIIGVLAAIAVLPALIVTIKSKHGYKGTFFATPETTTSAKVQKVKARFTQQKAKFDDKENTLNSESEKQDNRLGPEIKN